MPSFDHTVALLVAASPLIVALIALVQALVSRERKAKSQPAVGVTTPTPDDDHADEAIAALQESRDEWKKRAQDAEAKLREREGERRGA